MQFSDHGEFRKLHEERSDVANATRGKGPAWEASVAPRAELENACGGGPCGRRLLKVMSATSWLGVATKQGAA